MTAFNSSRRGSVHRDDRGDVGSCITPPYDVTRMIRSRLCRQWCRFLGRRLDARAAGIWPTSEKRPGTKSREVWDVAEAGAMGICRLLCGWRWAARPAACCGLTGYGHLIAWRVIVDRALSRLWWAFAIAAWTTRRKRDRWRPRASHFQRPKFGCGGAACS